MSGIVEHSAAKSAGVAAWLGRQGFVEGFAQEVSKKQEDPQWRSEIENAVLVGLRSIPDAQLKSIAPYFEGTIDSSMYSHLTTLKEQFMRHLTVLQKMLGIVVKASSEAAQAPDEAADEIEVETDEIEASGTCEADESADTKEVEESDSEDPTEQADMKRRNEKRLEKKGHRMHFEEGNGFLKLGMKEKPDQQPDPYQKPPIHLSNRFNQLTN